MWATGGYPAAHIHNHQEVSMAIKRERIGGVTYLYDPADYAKAMGMTADVIADELVKLGVPNARQLSKRAAATIWAAHRTRG